VPETAKRKNSKDALIISRRIITVKAKEAPAVSQRVLEQVPVLCYSIAAVQKTNERTEENV
jgi:hypothetical protein